VQEIISKSAGRVASLHRYGVLGVGEHLLAASLMHFGHVSGGFTILVLEECVWIEMGGEW
jgi:hypothetical protein